MAMIACVSSGVAVPSPRIRLNSISTLNATNSFQTRWRKRRNINCESSASAAEEPSQAKSWKVEIGSPVILIEAPKMIKTATAIPCLRLNSGIVKPGDVGRIMSRKPKDVWAVRLKVGTYLIDGRYFKPLELDQQLDPIQSSI